MTLTNFKIWVLMHSNLARFIWKKKIKYQNKKLVNKGYFYAPYIMTAETPLVYNGGLSKKIVKTEYYETYNDIKPKEKK